MLIILIKVDVHNIVKRGYHRGRLIMVELDVDWLRAHRVFEDVEDLVLLGHVIVGCYLVFVDQVNLVRIIHVESQPLRRVLNQIWEDSLNFELPRVILVFIYVQLV